MAQDKTTRKIIADVMRSPGNRVKIAVVDIDGILRGKYIHKQKFASAAESGFGFCDVVYGWDSQDACYDNTTSTGWHEGYPDARARSEARLHADVLAGVRVLQLFGNAAKLGRQKGGRPRADHTGDVRLFAVAREPFARLLRCAVLR